MVIADIPIKNVALILSEHTVISVFIHRDEKISKSCKYVVVFYSYNYFLLQIWLSELS
jgi:hypothetical protein